MDGPPPPEEDFSSIPLLDRVSHSNWKARLSAYEALPKAFSLTTSDSDPTFRPYLSDPGLLKKIATDSNAVAQEKGLEALCALVQYSGENSARTRETVVPALVDKCLGSARAGTKAKAIELILKYIEVENGGEAVIRDILPGLSAKQPKIVSGTVTALNEAFKAFGIKVIPPKEALKTLPKIFGHSDKTVRAEGNALVQSLYTFLGQGIQPFLSELKPVQVKELNEAFAKMDEASTGQGSGKPTRLTRAQEREREAAELAGGSGEAAEEEAEEPPDPRLLVDEVDIVPKLPADFHTLVASSKWKERKEVLDAALELVNANPRIKDSDGMGELAKALGKRMTDANIQCVIAAAQVIEGLSKGVGQPFGKHRASIVPPMLERFKERKQNVVDAIGQGLDAFFATTTLPDVTEDILNTLKSKNPQVKEGTAKFLARSLSTTRIPPAKGDVKPMSELLVTLLEDGYEPVRAAAAEGLGTLLKIVGERQLNPVIDPLDDLRKAKVKEAFEKATVKCKAGAAPPAPKAAPPAAKAPPKGAAKKPAAPPPAEEDKLMDDFGATPKAKPPARFLAKKAPALAATEEEELAQPEPPKAAPPAKFAKKAPAPAEDALVEDEAPPKPAAKPPARLTKKPPAAAAPPAAKKPPPAAAAPAGKAGGKAAAPAPGEPVKFKFSSEDALQMAEELVPPQLASDLGDGNWKTRLAGMEEFITWLEGGNAETAECEVLFRFLSKKPGWNEKNFQVSAKVYAALAILAEKSPTFSKSCVAISTGHLAEKLGDMKLKKPAGDALLLFAEKTSLSFVLDQAYEPMSKQKAPKVLADSIGWVGQALTDFGIAGLTLRNLVGFLKTALGNSNAAVRSSATSTLVTLRLFAGPGIKDLLEDVNPQLLATIEGEFAKVDGQPAPTPTRFSADNVEVAATGGGKGKSGGDPLDELFPRVDLDKLVAGTTIIADAKSDAWKSRKEALELLQSILDVGANKRLKPNMGDIGPVLKSRVGDSNKVVQLLALDIVSRIATGMNKPFEKHARLLARPVADVLADQKANIRSAGTSTLSAMATACEGIDPLINPLTGALESNNPLLRGSLLHWMAEWLNEHPPAGSSELAPWISPVIACLEDRNGDVRKGAQAVLPSLITSCGFDAIMDKTSSLKATSRSTVVPMIQAAKALAKPSAASTSAPSAPAGSAAPKLEPPRSAAPRSVATSPVPEEPTSAATASAPTAKKAPTNLRMRKIEPSSRPESRLDSPVEPPPSAGLNGARKPLTRPTSALPPPQSPSMGSNGIPFSGASLDQKKNRLQKDGPRWIVEGLPVRKDLADTLHHQMELHVSKDLLSLLFSKDHNAVNDFVKGLGIIVDTYSIAEDDETIKATLIANSDLCFKYVSMKIHEPQSNLVTRCLDVLDSVIGFLTSCDYSISETEASCFIPTIINKLGDSREPVRLRVQTVVQNLAKIYPSSRLYHLLLDHGLKSKVAKTRQGALEEMAAILKRVGLSPCEPTKTREDESGDETIKDINTPLGDDVGITISGILSSDPSRSVDALKKIQKILEVPPSAPKNAEFEQLTEHTEGLIETITLQMSHVFERSDDVAEAANFRLAKHLIQTLNSFCDHPVLAESLTVEILTSLLEELTMRLLQTDESSDPKVKDLSRFINMIVLRVFAAGRRISIFRALFALLLQIMKPFPTNGTTAESKDAKLAELVLKCVWKMARSIPQELQKGHLDAVELFPAIERFLQSIPPNEWRSRAQNRIPLGDMPLRTVKVIIQHIVAQYPEQVYDQLSEAFDDPSATIVYPYVYRILNSAPSRPGGNERTRPATGASEDPATETVRSGSPTSSRHASPPPRPSSDSSSRAGVKRERSSLGFEQNGSSNGHPGSPPFGYAEALEPDPDDRLIEIIDHISSETTGAMHKEGITELHHFLKEFPHKKPKVDKMLDATGPAFRKYIARALASRAAEDEEREVAVADTLSKLEHKRESSGSAIRRVSAGSPNRLSNGGNERRFSTASEIVPDDKALSRLHDIFRYQGPRSSISLSNPQRTSLPSQPEL
ncbi:Microtubule-associated protein, microtubule dynamics during spindle orientation [Tulasnella sp. 408]|nr:Microtubule-associated protein, microtubule dynamics during spindle orientation [Tulasnella sp. 408]